MTAYMDHKDLTNQSISDERATQIADNVHRVLDTIAQAESRSGRAAGSVTLLAATKTRDVGEIMAAIDAGIHMIGENRPQEIVAKIDGLLQQCAQRNIAVGSREQSSEYDALPLHLIGQLQSNKINKIIGDVSTVESVDSLALAQKIARKAAVAGRECGVCLEVNESGEESKSGCAPDEAYDLALEIAALDGLQLQGFMTVGAHVDDEHVIRAGFAHLRELRDRVHASGEAGTGEAQELSMGMSSDMALAIDEGATIVRIGTAIFGERAFK